MGHENQRLHRAQEEVLQPGDGFDVQVVGGARPGARGRVAGQGAGQERPALESARERVELGPGVELEAREHRVHHALGLEPAVRVQAACAASSLASAAASPGAHSRARAAAWYSARVRPSRPMPETATSNTVPGRCSGTSCCRRATLSPWLRDTTPRIGREIAAQGPSSAWTCPRRCGPGGRRAARPRSAGPPRPGAARRRRTGRPPGC